MFNPYLPKELNSNLRKTEMIQAYKLMSDSIYSYISELEKTFTMQQLSMIFELLKLYRVNYNNDLSEENKKNLKSINDLQYEVDLVIEKLNNVCDQISTKLNNINVHMLKNM